jgi:acetyl esterase/lipase
MALRFVIAPLAAGLLLAPPASAQTSVADWTAALANELRVAVGITYLRASNHESKLDVYTPRAAGPHPTVIHIHGGGWVAGSREGTFLRALPYLEMGFAVVNISYRLGPVAEAPAAVEDTLCAVRWVVRNAKEYGFDVNRIVTTGYSAGGHLALAAGMIPASTGLDRRCPGQEPLTVAAIVNWYGITDVVDLIDGPNTRSYAVQWLGSAPNRAEVARRLSPMTYVRRDLPPVLTIHGDADPVVPYGHATSLDAALRKAGATSELVTIPKGGHGNFVRAEQLRATAAVRAFLTKHGIVRAPVTSTASATAR